MPVNDANCLMMSQQLLEGCEKVVYIGKKLRKLSTDGKDRQTLTSWQMYYICKDGMETKDLTF